MKYHNKKTLVDGVVFDSKLESEFYLAFKKANDITILERQPKITLTAGKVVRGGEKVLPIIYISDFLIDYKGRTYLVDPKGVVTKEFTIKMKLFKLLNYPHQLIVAKSLADCVYYLQNPTDNAIMQAKTKPKKTVKKTVLKPKRKMA
jgi:predicted nuclease of restriction endonuclease-like RecB superfamily